RRGGDMTAHRIGRVISYVVMVVIGLVGIAPFLYLLLLSTKSLLDILEGAPSLDFHWPTIKANYAEVIHEDGYFTYVKNSILVTGISTLIALGLGVPRGYPFLAHR